MAILMSIFFLIVSIIVYSTAFVCPKTNGTYPHEWNKAAYYYCSQGCAYEKNCSSKSYYSNTTNQCKLEPADWSPQYDLTGRYQSRTSTFMEIRQIGYDVQWTSEDTVAIYTFIGRYINETMVTGVEIRLIRRSNCITLQEFVLSVSGKRNFCLSRAAFHWYTRTCGYPDVSPYFCYIY
jgi:hypothetical protein